MQAIAEIGKYILKKNELLSRRQKARSKVGYYRTLLILHGTKPDRPQDIRGWKKWSKPGLKGRLRILVKKWKIEQMAAEIEMHELVIASRKDQNRLRKEVNVCHFSSTGDNMILGVVQRNAHFSVRRIYLRELEQIVIDEEAENILLRGVI